MADDILNQEEIDALLAGDVSVDDDDEYENSAQELSAQGPFSAEQVRALLDIAEHGVVKEVSVFQSSLGDKEILLSNPALQVIDGSALVNDISSMDQVLVSAGYDEGKFGFIISGLSASVVVKTLTEGQYDGIPVTNFTDFELSALVEFFQLLLGKLQPALKADLGYNYSPKAPVAVKIKKGDASPESALLREKELVEIAYDFSVADSPDSKFRFLIGQDLAKHFLMQKFPGLSFGGGVPEKKIEAAPVAAATPSAAPDSSPTPAIQPPAANQGGGASVPSAPDPAMQQQMWQQQQAMMQQQMAAQQQAMAAQQPSQQQPTAIGYSPWQFAPLSPFAAGTAQANNMELLKDVPLQVTVELGRARMPIGQILELTNGSTVELNKQAGEAVELYVQGKLIARGEVVILDENFAIRITSIISPGERLGSMMGV
jgi:flagellar motor switch protein FliN/FliY